MGVGLASAVGMVVMVMVMVMEMVIILVFLIAAVIHIMVGLALVLKIASLYAFRSFQRLQPVLCTSLPCCESRPLLDGPTFVATLISAAHSVG